MSDCILSGKNILLISPQSWGKMRLAKHHYAIELAKRGNIVYFLEPPDNKRWSLKKARSRISIERVAGCENLLIIHQKLYFPYRLKFHCKSIYNWLVSRQIRHVLNIISTDIDIIWSFDLGNLFPLSLFPKKYYKIFHPVDEPRDREAVKAAKGANIIISVTREILQKFRDTGLPLLFVNHGLSEDFLSFSPKTTKADLPMAVGMSGNLLRPDLDRAILLTIIRQNENILFHFFGTYQISESNIGGSYDDETILFLHSLQSFHNVVFHGVLGTEELVKQLNQMDALLICYDNKLDQSKGTNYHKIMEYLSAGKVILSNNITTYSGRPDLVRMVSSRATNEDLPRLFTETIDNIGEWNSAHLVNIRKQFAAENRYQKQLDKIEKFICSQKKS